MCLKSNMKAVILAGGEGKDMRPLSIGIPKTLIKLLGKPVVCYVIDALISVGISDIAIVVGNSSMFEHELSEYLSKYDIKLIEQVKPEVEGAILSASNFISGSDVFLLAYGDIIAPTKAYEVLLNTYISRSSDAAILITPKVDVETYGVPIVSNEFTIRSVMEKPEAVSEIEYAVAGAYVLPSKFIDLIEEEGNVIRALNDLSARYTVAAALWSGWWVDVGFPWDLITASEYLLSELRSSRISVNADMSPRAVIQGPVIIGDEAAIDHNAVIKGPVYIGEKTYIGTGALIRNYSSIESECIVGAYSEISRSVIQPQTSIGRMSFVGDSIVGFKSVIEPGVTILNVLPSGVEVSRLYPVKVRGKLLSKLGAIVGNNCRIRAHTVVYAGTIINSGEIYP